MKSRKSGMPDLYRQTRPLKSGAPHSFRLEPPLLHNDAIAGAQRVVERHVGLEFLAIGVAGELDGSFFGARREAANQHRHQNSGYPHEEQSGPGGGKMSHALYGKQSSTGEGLRRSLGRKWRWRPVGRLVCFGLERPVLKLSPAWRRCRSGTTRRCRRARNSRAGSWPDTAGDSPRRNRMRARQVSRW
jgi:hypothetical protein